MKKKQILRALMKKKQVLPFLAVGGLVTLILLIFLGAKLIDAITPTKEHMELTKYYNITDESQVAISINNEVSKSQATLINGHIYLDYQFVHDEINERFYWDENENILLYTTAKELISANANENTYTIAKSYFDYGRPVVKATADSAWVDLEFVKKYSDFTYTFFESPNRLVITNDWKEITTSTLRGNTEIRFEGGIKSPILVDAKKGDVLTILETDKKWSRVCTSDGVTGYIRSNKVKKTQSQKLTSDFEPEVFSHITKNKTLNFLWHPTFSKGANKEITNILSTTKGVDVLSPSWFKPKDNAGNISSFATNDYVTYAHDHGVEVWAMVKNFDLDSSDIDVNYILTHTSSRQNLVNQIVAQALQYNLDGINIDFESIKYDEVGDAYIQFLRELSLLCNDRIVLSTAVHVPAPNNKAYKYHEQANFVDYVCIMAYDQHWGQESGEGPVASIDWVEESIQNTLNEGVPENQLVLGVPFYSRLWTLTPSTNEETGELEYAITKKNYGITNSQKWIDDNIGTPVWKEENGQYYGEMEKDGIIYKMWLEDATSIEKKLTLVQKYKLAGAAFWSSDLDNASIWDVVIKYIN